MKQNIIIYLTIQTTIMFINKRIYYNSDLHFLDINRLDWEYNQIKFVNKSDLAEHIK